jgi:hypothetical protein
MTPALSVAGSSAPTSWSVGIYFNTLMRGTPLVGDFTLRHSVQREKHRASPVNVPRLITAKATTEF